jgi:protocatechuate 3,4-dioxygenase alpha subunit
MAHETGALTATASQTVGPYFRIGLEWLFSDRVAESGAPGRHIRVEGRVVDGGGAPVPDALLEVWQADANGRYPSLDDALDSDPTRRFRGHARVPTQQDGSFRFTTVIPGHVPAPGGGVQAPHISVAVFMRGLLKQAATRIYFAGQPSNASDPVLSRVPEARQHTLLAQPRAGEPDVFEWNVVLQGPDETVFFDF